MRTRALLTLVAVSSLHCSPLTPPGVEVLIPHERCNRARAEDDEPLSDIPDSAFTLDDGVRVIGDTAPLVTSALSNTRGQANKNKARKAEEEVDHRMRSSTEGKRPVMSKPAVDVWRNCQGLTRGRSGPVYEVLLVLCGELLDAAGPSSTHSSPHALVAGQPRAQLAPAADGCTSTEAPRRVHARRDYMMLGDNANIQALLWHLARGAVVSRSVSAQHAARTHVSNVLQGTSLHVSAAQTATLAAADRVGGWS